MRIRPVLLVRIRVCISFYHYYSNTKTENPSPYPVNPKTTPSLPPSPHPYSPHSYRYSSTKTQNAIPSNNSYLPFSTIQVYLSYISQSFVHRGWYGSWSCRRLFLPHFYIWRIMCRVGRTCGMGWGSLLFGLRLGLVLWSASALLIGMLGCCRLRWSTTSLHFKCLFLTLEELWHLTGLGLGESRV